MLGKIKIVVYLVQDNGLKIVQKMMIKFEFIYNIEKEKKKHLTCCLANIVFLWAEVQI
jgi:hypothetical protein